MFRQISILSQKLASIGLAGAQNSIRKPLGQKLSSFQPARNYICTKLNYQPLAEPGQKLTSGNRLLAREASSLCNGDKLTQTGHCFQIISQNNNPLYSKSLLSRRQFHAHHSKVNYLDFRYRVNTTHLGLHLTIIRRQKMKKHKRRKFRKKFKCLLAKQRLKREIAKEKLFRVELLTMIRRAESFDPKEYALRKIAEIHNKPKELTKKEKFEQLKELIRVNRYQTTYIKPKHIKALI